MYALTQRLLYFTLLVLAFAAKGQVIKFERYTTSDGLLSDEVYNLYQDSEGYLWIFTNYGVQKYNGQVFKPVLKNLKVDEKFVFAFYQHQSGRKWVASSKANIYEVIDDSVVHVPGTEKASEHIRNQLHEIFSLYVDDSLNIYAVTKHDTYKFTRQPAGYTGKTLSTGPSDSLAFRVYEKDHATVSAHNFRGDDSTMCGGLDKVRVRAELKTDTLYAAFPCQLSLPKHFKQFGQDIYFLHHDKLIRISRKGNKSIHLGVLSHNFTKDRNGHTWIATYQNGLLELDANDSLINRYFGNVTVDDVLQDKQGGLWVSTAGFGLFHCPDLNHKYYGEPHQLASPITLVKKISRGVVVASTAGDVFLLRHGNESPEMIYHHPGGDLMGVTEKGDSLIMLFRFGVKCLLFRKNGTTKVPHPYDMLSIVSAVIHEDKVYYLQRKRISYFERSQPKLWNVFSHRVFDLAFKDGYAYVALDVGLFQHASDGKLLQEIEALHNIPVKKIVRTPGGDLLCLSPGHGVFLVKDHQEVTQITEKQGLPGNIVTQVLFEPFGIILATTDGLYFSASNSNAQSLENRSWSKFYTGGVTHAVVADSTLLVGTLEGLVVMTQAQLKGHSGADFHVESILVNGRKVMPRSLSQLKYTENNIEVDFDIVTFDKFRPAVYYQLTGPFADRGLVSSSPLKLRHLPHGSYQLRIWPDTPDHNEQAVVLQFRILPAYWETPLFIFLASLALFFILLLVFIGVNKYYRKKQDQKALAQNKLLEYKLIALKAQINPHFMSNCLSAIQHLIISNRVDEASGYIAKFGFLVRQILKYSDQSLISLKDEISLAKLFMDLEQLRFDKKLNYVVSIAPEIDPATTLIPGLILNPIIENAIWHGLLPVKNERSCLIRIEARQQNGLMELSVSDNGVGRKKNNAGNAERESRGEALIAQRLVNINLLMNTNACQVRYSDIFNGDIVQGTKVTLLLPTTFKTHINA